MLWAGLASQVPPGFLIAMYRVFKEVPWIS